MTRRRNPTEPLAGGHAPDASSIGVGSEREAATVPPARHTHEIVRVELPRYWCSCGAWLWNDGEDLDLHRKWTLVQEMSARIDSDYDQAVARPLDKGVME